MRAKESSETLSTCRITSDCRCFCNSSKDRMSTVTAPASCGSPRTPPPLAVRQAKRVSGAQAVATATESRGNASLPARQLVMLGFAQWLSQRTTEPGQGERAARWPSANPGNGLTTWTWPAMREIFYLDVLILKCMFTALVTNIPLQSGKFITFNAKDACRSYVISSVLYISFSLWKFVIVLVYFSNYNLHK